MRMELGIILTAAVLFGGLSLVLLQTEKDAGVAVREPSAGQDAEVPVDADAAPGTRGRIWAAAIFAINISVSVFRFFYYDAGVIGIVNLTLLCSVLWACAWIDRRELRIPNRFLMTGAVLRCVLLIVECFTEPGEIKYTLLRYAIAAVALLIVALLCRLVTPGAIGLGDVKLLVLMAFCLGTDGIWNVMFCSIIAAFFASVHLVLTKKATRKTEIPFAPFLLVGTVAASFLMYF